MLADHEMQAADASGNDQTQKYGADAQSICLNLEGH